MIHQQAHPMAGTSVLLARGGWERQPFKFVDWWDRHGAPWRASDDPRARHYEERRAHSRNDHTIPEDDEVVFGLIGPHLVLVHASELPD